MPDADADRAEDRLPLIVLCGYDAEDEVWDPVEDLSGAHWRPAGARALSLNPDHPDRLYAILAERLEDRRCRALLLVGRSRHAECFTVQMRAENRALTGDGRLNPDLPSLARATLPAADVVAALNAAGLKAQATSEAEPDVGSYLLFRILAELPEVTEAPAVGLLRVPAEATLDTARRGVKAAAAAVAAQLGPMARMQHA